MNKNVLIGGALVLAYFLFRKKSSLNVDKRIFTNMPNADIVYQEILKAGYTNPYTIAAMLSTIERESRFTPQGEISYKNTSNRRIRKIFKTKLGSKSDEFINNLKANDVDFFDYVYGGRYGNDNKGDGYTYRGRGFNGITFKGIYRNVGNKMGVNLVSKPELLNNIDTAAAAFVAYTELAYQDSLRAGKWQKNFKNSLDKAATQEEANKMLLKLNAGWDRGYTSDTYKYLVNRSPYFYGKITD